MRDPKRIEKVLSEIRRIWTKYPDLRLMQLLLSCEMDIDMYEVEDDDLIQLIQIYESQNEKH